MVPVNVVVVVDHVAIIRVSVPLLLWCALLPLALRALLRLVLALVLREDPLLEEVLDFPFHV